MSYVCSLIQLVLFQPFLRTPVSPLLGFHCSNILCHPHCTDSKTAKGYNCHKGEFCHWPYPGMQRILSRSDIDHSMSCKESIGVYDSPAHLHFLLNSFSTWFTLSSLAAQRGTQQCRITRDSVRNLEPQSHPRAASSQSVFYQDPQVTLKHSKVGELQVLAQNFWIPSSSYSHHVHSQLGVSRKKSSTPSLSFWLTRLRLAQSRPWALVLQGAYLIRLSVALSCDLDLPFLLINGWAGSLAPFTLPELLEMHLRISYGWPEGPHPASSHARCNRSQSSEVYDLFLVLPNVQSRCPCDELARLMAYLNTFQVCSFRPLLPRGYLLCENTSVMKP